MSRFPAFSALLAAWLVVLPGWEIPVRAEAPPRAAKVAGQFYPDDPNELSRLIIGLLHQHPEPVAAHKPRVLIVPREAARLGSGLGSLTPAGAVNWKGLEDGLKAEFAGRGCVVGRL